MSLQLDTVLGENWPKCFTAKAENDNKLLLRCIPLFLSAKPVQKTRASSLHGLWQIHSLCQETHLNTQTRGPFKSLPRFVEHDRLPPEFVKTRNSSHIITHTDNNQDKSLGGKDWTAHWGRLDAFPGERKESHVHSLLPGWWQYHRWRTVVRVVVITICWAGILIWKNSGNVRRKNHDVMIENNDEYAEITNIPWKSRETVKQAKEMFLSDRSI